MWRGDEVNKFIVVFAAGKVFLHTLHKLLPAQGDSM